MNLPAMTATLNLVMIPLFFAFSTFAWADSYKYLALVSLDGLLFSSTADSAITHDGNSHSFPALQLNSPISVLCDSGEKECHSELGVTMLQLVLKDPQFDQFKSLKGKQARVEGNLFNAHTGHHYTSVLLDVKSISIPNSIQKGTTEQLENRNVQYGPDITPAKSSQSHSHAQKPSSDVNTNTDWRTQHMTPEEILALDTSLEGPIAARNDPRFNNFLSNLGISSDKVPNSGWPTLLYIFRNREEPSTEYKNRLADIGNQYLATERLRKYHEKLYHELQANWKLGTLEQAEVMLARIAGTIGAPGKDWYVMSRDSRSCFKKGTPAERIAELQAGAENVKTNDLSNGGVEVGYYDNEGNFIYRTYFPSKEDCLANLPANRPIPDKYK